LEKYIKKKGNQFCVYSKAGKELGCHPTKNKALAQLRAIESNKSSLSSSLDNKTLGGMENMTDESKNKREDKMPEEEKPEDKPETPEEKPEEEKQEEPEEEPEEGKIAKMYSAKEVEEKIQKAVESQSVRKAAQETPPESTKGAEITLQKIAELGGSQWEGGVTKVFGAANANGAGGTIVDGRNDIDYRKDHSMRFKEAYDTIRKATLTTTGGVGTAGYALIPVYVDPDIIDRTRRLIPFIELVPRKAVQGLTYDYNAITTMAAAVALNEDAALADVTDTYDRFSVTIRSYYSVGRVTGQAIAASRGYVDKLNLEVQNRTIALKRKEDSDALTNQSAPSFTGIEGLVTTNTTALSGPLTISAIRTEVTQCEDSGGSRGDMIIVTTNTLRDSLKGLLMDYQRYVDTTTLAWGIEKMSFDGIPVIADRYVSSGYFWILDMSVIFMAVLQDMVYEELAKTNDSIKFSLKMYEALVCRAEAFCSGLSGAT